MSSARSLRRTSTRLATALGDVAGDPPGPLPGIGGSLLLDTFTAEAADTYADGFGDLALAVAAHLMHATIRLRQRLWPGCA